MRVDNLGFQQVSFGNALSTRQEEEQKKLIKEVKLKKIKFYNEEDWKDWMNFKAKWFVKYNI